jgi:hypothetical protein
MKSIRSFLKRISFHLFLLGDRLGIHVLPKHYSTPIADYRWLRANKTLWAGKASLVGVHWDLDEQARWLRGLCSPYYHEVQGFDRFRQLASSGIGAGYGPLESQVLHCFMRAKRPPTVVEIGSLVSTVCMPDTVRLNVRDGLPGTRIICVDPYPKEGFDRLEGITHIQKLGQEVPLGVFRDLRAGDLLFIDYSHAVKTGSDTVRIYLEVIPNLPPGVFIHIHDVTLPYLYHPDVLLNYMGWQETVLLLALLIRNPCLSVLACQSALHHERKQALAEILPDYRALPQVEGIGESHRSVERNHFPSSIWLQTRSAPDA